METKYAVAGAVIALAVSFSAGRYSVGQPTVSTVVDTKTKVDVAKDSDTNTKTKIVEVKTKDGTVTKTTTIEQIKDEDTKIVQDIQTHAQQTITPPKRNSVNISALMGTRLTDNFGVPIYGAMVSKEVLGMVTVGAFGLTNGTVGVSIGFTF
jgi:hypothetical protein